jgi:hypothetical protein
VTIIKPETDADREATWRQQLTSALAAPGKTLVLADRDDTSAMMSVRSQSPMHLVTIARMLLEQAQDRFNELDGDEAEDNAAACEDALAILPDPDKEEEG